MSIAESLKTNWQVLVQAFIAVAGVIVMYCIYRKGKSEKKVKEEDKFKANVRDRLAKLEKAIDMLTTLYPQLKSLEKLESFDKLNLTQEDIRKIVSEVLKATDITPEAIDVRIEKKIKKKFSDIDKGIATIVAQRLNEIDKQFKKPVGNASDYLILGNAEYAKGNYPKAIEHYEKVLGIRPDFAEAWYNKGVTLGKLGRRDEALKAYDKAIELKPDLAEAGVGKGAILGVLGRFDEALKAYDKAIELKPDLTGAWLGKGLALGELGRYDEALTAFNRAIELQLDLAGAWGGKGLALGKLGRYDEALTAFNKAKEITPDAAGTWYNSACIYSLRGDRENALRDLSKAIEFDAKCKEDAKKDEDFKNLWDDEGFKKIVS